MSSEEPLISEFKRRVDYMFNRDRVVKRHRRAIYRMEVRIEELRKKIQEEHALIRLRHKAVASLAAEAVRHRLASFRPSANQVYPRKVFRHTPPP